MLPGLNWIQIGGGAIAAFALSWLLHTVDVDRIEAEQQAALTAQEEKLHAECANDKAITKGVDDDLQAKNTALTRRIGELKRVQPSTCIVPAPNPSVSGNAAPGGTVSAGAHGITTNALYDFAFDAERYRLQLIACQDFISKTWTAKGQ